ncbi:30S ribosomal protein S1 [Alicyclobacillus ferrooxydans]|uniref:30S ribosomal protein S1 n=1 Tax=Alicyclobacillus ferrooxydans TaxID=471514 RepID=A0A0P9CV34_9BACL|nr:30S ribosomal protein S1 [Alicyclobacillus ferrooxydans]KPV43553.1 30S ribosomal protein S1 [Alicyclobacillus ferrooxydans]
MSEEIREAVTETTLNPGDVVTGRVTEVDDKKVVVDIGYAFQGIIPIRELSALRIDHPSEVCAVGDEVTTRVVKIDNEDQVVVLSKREAAAQGAWSELQDKFENGDTFEVTVQDVVKGGLVTDVGVRGFIPASLVDRKFVENLEEFKGQSIRVKVVELDAENNKLILSRKAVLDDEYEQGVSQTLHSLPVGSVVTGTVQRLTNFGAFVDVGGVDGLVHISELAWHHVDHPEDVVKPGDTVKVKILKVDPDAGRVSLSVREAMPSPWEQGVQEFTPGSVVTGIVRRIVDFGAFVELKPGLEGLVHISQIAHQHVAQASDVLEEGQEVKVKILSIDPERQRISLSIKDASEERPARREPQQQQQRYQSAPQDDSGTGATIGDLFRDLFKKQ